MKKTEIIQPGSVSRVEEQKRELPNQSIRLLELAITNSAPIENLERLMALQERWEAGNARKEFYAALSKFQSEIPVIPKRGHASFQHRDGKGKTEYDFAKLEDITEAIKPFLFANGLSYRFETNTQQGAIDVVCIVTHLSGHSERTKMNGGADNSGSKNLIQQFASTVSYLKRYTLCGALGITTAEEDDDAATAEIPEGGQEQQEVYYSQDLFNKNLASWTERVNNKETTPDRIINFLSKRTTLSPEQIQTIRDIK